MRPPWSWLRPVEEPQGPRAALCRLSSAGSCSRWGQGLAFVPLGPSLLHPGDSHVGAASPTTLCPSALACAPLGMARGQLCFGGPVRGCLAGDGCGACGQHRNPACRGLVLRHQVEGRWSTGHRREDWVCWGQGWGDGWMAELAWVEPGPGLSSGRAALLTLADSRLSRLGALRPLPLSRPAGVSRSLLPALSYDGAQARPGQRVLG